MHDLRRPKVSFLIPAYRATHSLRETVGAISTYLEERFGDAYEILLIPNGPGEQDDRENEAVCRALARTRPRVRCVELPPRSRGKGLALKRGFAVSRGQWIFSTDADLPYDLSFFDEAASALAEGVELVFANRRHPDSVFAVPVHLLPLVQWRHRLGLGFNRAVRLLFGLRVRDTQAGIRAMSRRFAERAFARQTCGGFFYDVEHFLVATHNGYRMRELPIRLSMRSEKSTIQLAREIWRAGYWLARIAINDQLLVYDLKRSILGGYRDLRLGEQVFLWLRLKLTPYGKMLAWLPSRGRVLDLGTGHGLFAARIALDRRGCEVVGIDHDQHRLRLATAAHAHVANLRFSCSELSAELGTLSDPGASWSAITVIDALHYLKPNEQVALLAAAHARLENGGVLLVREVDRGLGLRSSLNRLYEWVATRTRITKVSHGSPLTFRTPMEWSRLLRTLGFAVSWERCSHPLFSDVLFVARKSLRPFDSALHDERAHVVADDWGISPAVNRGILELVRRGSVHAVSVLVDSPWVEEGLEELLQVPNVQLGLHFNLTEGIRKRSTLRYRSPLTLWLTAVSPFTDRLAWQARVASEFKRQYSRLRELGIRPRHLDGHHHVHVCPGVIEAIAPIARELGIRRIRLPFDPALRWTARAPLLWWSRRARPIIDQHGFESRPFYYPPLEVLMSPERLRQEIAARPGYEIITHPASSDDLALVGSQDPYRAERVTEFETLRALTI